MEQQPKSFAIKIKQVHNQQQQQYKLYKKAEKEYTLFGGEKFKISFDQLKDCIAFQSVPQQATKMYKWRQQVNKGIPKDQQQLEIELPINRNPNFKNQNKIKYTWIGHSTFVLSIGKTNFLFDPVFQQTIGISPITYKRFRKAACSIEQLPRIDAVFVSHDHHDHLSDKSLTQLYKLHNPYFFAGLSSEDVFPQSQKLVLMNWTQKYELTINSEKFQITFVPAVHWSRRNVFDLNKRLWGGFVIKTPQGKNIYYSGDTGYSDTLFKEIGQHFGGFDLAVLPIGAYEPRWFLKQQHVDPKQSVQIHRDIKSKFSIGVHWGTFPLGNEHYTQARQLLRQLRQKQNVNFITVGHGESQQINL